MSRLSLSKSKGFKSLVLVIVFMLLTLIQVAPCCDRGERIPYGYLTKFKGEVYASSNWYINGSVISEKLGTVLLEDFCDSKYELDGNKLIT